MRNKFIRNSKLLLSVVLLTTISISSYGQFAFGGKLGYTQGNLAQHGSPMFQGKSGFAIGGFFDFSFEDMGFDFLAASAELLYMQQGASQVTPSFMYPSTYLNFLQNEGTYMIARTDVTLHTFELPLMVKFTAPGFSDDLKPYGTLGWSLGLITKAYAVNDYVFGIPLQDATNPGSFGMYTIEIDGRDDVSRNFLDWTNSFVLGGGLEFKGGDMPFYLDVKYFIGLSQIDDVATTHINTLNGDTDYMKNTLLFTVGIGIGN